MNKARRMPEGRFEVTDTPLQGLKLVRRKRVGDERGFLSRLFCADEFAEAGFTNPIVQINQTLTRQRGTIRGMHFQRPPHAEDKFISVLRGEIFDVAVDLRNGSPTFLHWFGTRLSDENSTSLFIPKGFAHGFQTLVENCELLYLHTAAYNPGAEAGLRPQDPALAIPWPEEVTEISGRDANHPYIDINFSGVIV